MISPQLPSPDIQRTSFEIEESGENKGYRFSSKESLKTNLATNPQKKEQGDTPLRTNEAALDKTTLGLTGLKETSENHQNSTAEEVYASRTEGADYSRAYIKHNAAALISQITELVNDWSRKGTADSISEISQIRTLLNDYADYLDQSPEYRILLGGLESVFDDDNWNKLNQAQLSFLSQQLKQFETGNVGWTSLGDTFRELWQTEIV